MADSRESLQQELEWRKCAKDPKYFVENFVFMWTKEGGDPIPFELWDCQKKALDEFEEHRLNIILKTRQLGMSWTACAYALWSVIFKANFHVYVQSIGQKEVTEQVERIKFIYENLPQWMRMRSEMGGKGKKRNDSLIQFQNGSAIHAVATTKRAGHGAAPGLYILDEFARNEQATHTWRAVKPSLGGRGKVIIISTANGLGNVFHEQWAAAYAGQSNFNPIFFPASSHPEYTPEFLERERQDYAGDPVGFSEAYPSSPEEAFQTSSKCPFPADIIQHWYEYINENGIEPETGKLRRSHGGGDLEWEQNPTGVLSIWKHPVRDRQDERGRFRRAHNYTIGADVAEGLTGGDFSVAVVLDTDTMEVVAMYRAKVAPEYYSLPLELLARYYNNAWLAVEVNRNADTIISDLKESYFFLYRRERRERITDVPTLEIGFYTSAKTKAPLISKLRAAMSAATQPLKIYSRVILSELSTYEESRTGSLGASGNNHDDCVIALAIAVEAMRTQPVIDARPHDRDVADARSL